MNPLITYNLRS